MKHLELFKNGLDSTITEKDSRLLSTNPIQSNLAK